MSAIVQATKDLLWRMRDEQTGRFSSTTSVRQGAYVSEYADPLSPRYSLISLRGLSRAAAAERIGCDVAAATEAFLAANRSRIRTPGDEGLLLSLLVERAHPLADKQYTRVRRLADAVRAGQRPSLQDASWLLSGLSGYASLDGQAEPRVAATSLFETLTDAYVDERSGVPAHVPAGLRRHLVSFGAIVYFLRALWDYAEAVDDPRARSLFAALTRTMLSRQGERGEWPWLYRVSSGRVAERYALYSVHQEAMAMLFLFPARCLGIPGAEDAIRRSYRWILGDNELGVPMWRAHPLLVHRSVRRRLPLGDRFARGRGGAPGRVLDRGTAFLRASWGSAAGGDRLARPDSLVVNEECRSYEMGWTAFVWAGVTGFAEFTEADVWRTGPQQAEAGRASRAQAGRAER